MLSVMSFNIRCACDKGTEAWEARIINLVPLVKNAAPDLMGVQEARHNQYLDLVERLPEYASVGVGRDDGINAGERAAIFYRKERFTLRQTGDFWLSETPEKPSLGWDAVCIRICTYAKFLDNRTRKEFTHYNTHLDHIGKTAKLEGAKLIRAHMLEAGAPSFVTGDFNINEKSEPYTIMTQDGLSDAKYAAKSSMSYGTFHGYKPSAELSGKSPIDYLFFTDGKFDIDSYEVMVNGSEGRYTSDHYPVLVRMAQI